MDAAETVGKLRALLTRGASIRAAAAAIELPKSTAAAVAIREAMPRNKARPPLARAKRQAVRKAISQAEIDGARRTIRDIAALTGVSKSTVQRIANPRLPGAPRPVRPYLCLGCRNRVIFKPCQICEAKEAGRGTARKRA